MEKEKENENENEIENELNIFSLSIKVATINISSLLSNLLFQADNNQNGEFSVKISSSLSNRITDFAVNIIAVNDPPVFRVKNVDLSGTLQYKFRFFFLYFNPIYLLFLFLL